MNFTRIIMFVSTVCLAIQGRCEMAFYQALIGYQVTCDIGTDLDGNPVYAEHAFHSAIDDLWYEPVYEWRYGEEQEYVEPEFFQTMVTYRDAEIVSFDDNGNPIYHVTSIIGPKDGRRYDPVCEWVESSEEQWQHNMCLTQVLEGYSEVHCLYYDEEGNTFPCDSPMAFKSSLDGKWYEPICSWEWRRAGFTDDEFQQVLVGYQDAQPIGYDDGAMSPIYSQFAFKSEKDGKWYEPIYEWQRLAHSTPTALSAITISAIMPEGVFQYYTNGVPYYTNAVPLFVHQTTSNMTFEVDASSNNGGALSFSWFVSVGDREACSTGLLNYDQGVAGFDQRYMLTELLHVSGESSFSFSPLEYPSNTWFRVQCCVSGEDGERKWIDWCVHVPRIFYVSSTSLAIHPDGLSWGKAFSTIQDAVDASDSGDTIYVGPGIYAQVGVYDKTIKIISTDGAAKTIIKGTQYSGSTYSGVGGGPCFAAVEKYDESFSVYESLRGQNIFLVGFTLREGDNAFSYYYSDCRGGGAYGGVLYNCVLEENRALNGGGAANARLVDCVVKNNHAIGGTGVTRCELERCTVVNNCELNNDSYVTSSDTAFGIDGNSIVRDSIIFNNKTLLGEVKNCYADGKVYQYNGSSYYGEIVVISNTVVEYSCSYPLYEGVNNIAEDPLFVDEQNGDFRLRSGSPCAGKGAMPLNPLFDSISEAVEASALHWATDADNPWKIEGSWIRSAPIGDSQSSMVDALAVGSGTLTFRWKISSEANRDRLSFSVDGIGCNVISGESDWQTVSVRVNGAGKHIFAWTYSKSKRGVEGEDVARLDSVRWMPDVDYMSLKEALDAPNVEWATSDDTGWRVYQEQVGDGEFYARSGVITNEEYSILSTTLTGPGQLSFKWRVSCEGYDGLDLCLDNEIVRYISGETDWEDITINISNGVHTLDWIYWKDELYCEGDDCGYLDQIKWSQATTMTTPVPVTYAWLDAHPQLLSSANGNYEDAASLETGKVDKNGKPMSAWQDYVMGTDPTNVEDLFKINLTISNTVPVITYVPDLGDERTYTIWGKTNITDSTWYTPTNSASRFFRVTVDVK